MPSLRRKYKPVASLAGFSLIELLVVISIMVTLLGLIFPALSHARQNTRAAVCGSNLHQMALATASYLYEHKETYWPYYQDIPDQGRNWWFGFEPDGPGQGANRLLDKSRAALAPYLSTLSDQFQCPSFPYEHPDYFPKFSARSASLGFNLTLANTSVNRYASGETSVFLFADAIHFDSNPGFNEGHYVLHTPNPVAKSGYAHFRHNAAAQMAMIDGHVASQKLAGDQYPYDNPGNQPNPVTPNDQPQAVFTPQQQANFPSQNNPDDDDAPDDCTPARELPSGNAGNLVDSTGGKKIYGYQ